MPTCWKTIPREPKAGSSHSFGLYREVGELVEATDPSLPLGNHRSSLFAYSSLEIAEHNAENVHRGRVRIVELSYEPEDFQTVNDRGVVRIARGRVESINDPSPCECSWCTAKRNRRQLASVA